MSNSKGLPDLGEAVEFGCGTGYFTCAIANKCSSLVATDLSDDLLQVAGRRLAEHLNVTVQKEDCMASSFPAESFDTVFMANLIHVVVSPAMVMQESSRILRNNGTVIIVTFTSNGMNIWEKLRMGLRFLVLPPFQENRAQAVQGQGETASRLDTIEKVIRGEEYAYVYMSSVGAYIIPCNAILEGDADEFLSELETLISMKQGV